jgi:hypothetical protein
LIPRNRSAPSPALMPAPEDQASHASSNTERGDTGNAPLRRCEHTTRSAPPDNEEHAFAQPVRLDSQKVLHKKHAKRPLLLTSARFHESKDYIIISISYTERHRSPGALGGQKTVLGPPETCAGRGRQELPRARIEPPPRATVFGSQALCASADAQAAAEALADFDRAIALNPRFAEADSNKGNSLTALRRFADAGACFDAALSLPVEPEYALDSFVGGCSRRRTGVHFAGTCAEHDPEKWTALAGCIATLPPPSSRSPAAGSRFART